MTLKSIAIMATIFAGATFASGQLINQTSDDRFIAFPTYDGTDLELTVTEDSTIFRLWSPEADAAQVLLYTQAEGGEPYNTLEMQSHPENGTWTASLPKKLFGKFYTFRIRHNGEWLKETPGVWAKAIGINGQRAAIIDFKSTNPIGWDNDRGPEIKGITDAVIYELHHRDLSMHPASGITAKGKFLALTEPGTANPAGLATGIDHLRELGVTHVHILPSYDFNSIDEKKSENAYNWGYDPLNYNVPEGSYATDPYNPAIRIKEFKEMVQALHNAGIGVVMDVVYNHTALNDDSNFNLTAPGYYHRHREDGTYSDASGCGNETASDRQQMRNFIVNSVKYWATQYHLDGFRFDLMAIHDTETMNQVAQELRQINPSIIIYGEGWTAGDSPLPVAQRALKENVSKMQGIAVFSDDIRDAVKGHYSQETDTGFATGKPGLEETVKIGIVGATPHPQVDYSKGNNSKLPYAHSADMVINYVSCHDDLCLTDKLRISMPDANDEQRKEAAKLAQTIIFTSQGTPFIRAGEEIFSDKKRVHNSYRSPDSINAINWNLKTTNRDQFEYYRNLIALRKAHPAFHMTDADLIAKHLVFDEDILTPNIISYSLNDHANGDAWTTIRIAFNGSDKPVKIRIPRLKKGQWKIVAKDGKIRPDGSLGATKGGKVTLSPYSALILAED